MYPGFRETGRVAAPRHWFLQLSAWFTTKHTAIIRSEDAPADTDVPFFSAEYGFHRSLQ